MARSARFPAYIRYSTFPSAPLTGLSITPLHVETDLARKRDDGFDGRGALHFIAHDSALSDVRLADFELRLDQRDELAAKKRRHRGQDQLQRDEGDVDGDELDDSSKSAAVR